MNLVGRLLALAVAIALLALSADLAVSNPLPVVVNLWFLESGLVMPVWLLAIGSFAAGLVMGGIAMLGPLIRSAFERRQLKARIRKLESDANSPANSGRSNDNLRLPGA